jgi:nicotinamide-nucleotide amidase
MNASILAIGSEMLGTSRLDTNSLKLTKVLEDYAVPLIRKSVVGDSLDDLVRELHHLAQTSDLVLVTGGLGPTEDDLTREAAAGAFGLELRQDPSVLETIEARFVRRNMKMPEVNKRQANVFAGQELIANARGTAPGFHLEVQHAGATKHVFLFPGVPYELEGMIASALVPWLAKTTGAEPLLRRVLRITGATESGVEQRLGDFYRRWDTHHTSILASPGEIQLHLQASGGEASRIVGEMERQLRDVFGVMIFGVDDESLESVVGRLLSERNETLAVAESCTGGLLGSRISDVPGSSSYFAGGVIAYSGEIKRDIVGVDEVVMKNHGQVSEKVAIELASKVREKCRTTYGIGITGIAGPGGGSSEKPVGLVHVAVASAQQIEHREANFLGTREMIKRQSTQLALDTLRRMLLRFA